MNRLPSYLAYFNRTKRRWWAGEGEEERGNVEPSSVSGAADVRVSALLSSPHGTSSRMRGHEAEHEALMNGRWKVRWWNMFVWTVDIRTIDSAKYDICAAGVTLRHCPHHCDILTADVWNKTSVVTTLNYRKIQSTDNDSVQYCSSNVTIVTCNKYQCVMYQLHLTSHHSYWNSLCYDHGGRGEQWTAANNNVICDSWGDDWPQFGTILLPSIMLHITSNPLPWLTARLNSANWT